MRKNLYKVSFLLLALIFLNKTRPYLDSNAHVEFLDVGQGDSTLIRKAHNREVILIDTGGQVGKTRSNYYVTDNTITYLNSLGIDKIDYLILTHGDADHLGDAMHLMNKIKVENVILNEGEYNAKEKEILKSGANVIDHYDGHLRLTSLNDQAWQDENANSIVLHLKLEGREFLFMGDAPKEVENYITKKYKPHADFVKLGHHGSSTSSGEDFLKSVNPEVAIISSGRKNRYNHPSPTTIDTLHNLLIDYYDTQDSGTITLSLKQGRVTTSTYPP